MPKILGFALFFLFILMLSACNQLTSKAYHAMLRGMYKNSVPLIGVAELEELLENGANAKPVLLDARSREEYNVSHLQDARFTDFDSFAVEQLEDLPKTTSIVVYCAVGYRSERVGEQLKRAGYVHVYNLYGGIFEWMNKGLPMHNERGQTQKIHAFSRTWGIWLTSGEKVYE